MGSEYNLWTTVCPLASAKIDRSQGGGKSPELRKFLISSLSVLFLPIYDSMSMDCLHWQARFAIISSGRHFFF